MIEGSSVTDLTILYYTILYYAMLCYAILYYTILYYTPFCCSSGSSLFSKQGVPGHSLRARRALRLPQLGQLSLGFPA